MKIVTIVQQKGGAGKTTLAYLLASGAIANGQKVHLIDGDRNAQLAQWKERVASYSWETDIPAWPPALSFEKMAGSVDEFYVQLNKQEQQKTDLVIVDTRPGSNEDTEDIAYAADVVLVPVRANPADFELARQTFVWLAELQNAFPDLERFPAIRMVLSDAPKPIIDAIMGSDLKSITKSEMHVLESLLELPFFETPIPASKICEQLPFFGPLNETIITFGRNKGQAIQVKACDRILDHGRALAVEVMKARGKSNGTKTSA